jgi:glycine dehydrogenase subunit 2
MFQLERALSEIAGFTATTLSPAAGAQGELTGIMMIRAYHQARGNPRKKVLVPDTAHGTNPASCAQNGYDVVQLASGPDGRLHPETVRAAMDEDVAAIMITNPNTLGVFESHIAEIAEIVHAKGGLVYGDGANLNALLGVARPGDMGFDVMHFNLHKTFSTPHGGGGPGSGPVGVKKHLIPFLPVPTVEFDGKKYWLDYNRPQSIGQMKSFYGNFLVIVKAYAYIRSLGPDGLKAASEDAVLNANYILRRITEFYDLPYDRHYKHEFVVSPQRIKTETGCHTMDISKRLLDYGVHPPTNYFPLIVDEAIMIEPTETESKDTLDFFADALIEIAKEAYKDPQSLHDAPKTTVVGRLDEVGAAKNPRLRWRKDAQ